MEAFPRTQAEFQRVFRRESACRRFLLGCRWPGGFQCSSCEGRRHWINNRLVLVCAGCRREHSLTAGTVLHKSRKPLTLWFQAMWWVVTQKTGGSAKGLQRLMGFGSYQTAWAWLHKLRRAMVRAERGSATNRKTNKAEVVVAVEVQGAGMGRVRIQVVPDSTTRSLMNFVEENIEPGSRIVTDGWPGYAQLEARGYHHSSYTLYGVAARAAKALPRVHRVISLVKRWLLGTHQGRCTRRHMQAYMDEFVFRFNRRKSRHVGNLFKRMLEQVGQSAPVTFRQLTTSGRIRHHNP